MELGLHIADFTWNGGAAELGGRLAQHARYAEATGIARITVMDHFWQAGGAGTEEREILEAHTTLGFIAARTTKLRIHTLASGISYRDPGLLAKQVTTLDVLSGGRAGLGIGAALEAVQPAGPGFDFPPPERFERLEEAIQICLQTWSGPDTPYDGKYYHLARARKSVQGLGKSRPYLLVGGDGENRTLRLAAQYADACNFRGGPEVFAKFDVLKQHCHAVGRDYDEIEKTTMLSINPSMSWDSFVRSASSARDAGFAAAYIFARDITDPPKIIDLLGSVVPELA